MKRSSCVNFSLKKPSVAADADVDIDEMVFE
jgi:hypothetical protein